ncbi:MAG: SDR family NAD(P)-dependent oxidoreductase [Phycisphaerales bacterium]
MTNSKSKVVLITGASSGIGEALALALAARGDHVVLVARSLGRLEVIAERVREARGIVTVLPADLSKPGAAQAVFDEVMRRGLSLDVLVNNAGLGHFGAFHEEPAAHLSEQLFVNVVALTQLSHLFVPHLLTRRGTVLNIASTIAFQPAPYMSVYGATKAFVLSLSEALWAEYRGSGLRVVALCPGPVETPFIDAAGADLRSSRIFKRPSTVSQVGSAAVAALDGYGPTRIVGTMNWIMAQGARFAPRAFTARLSGWLLGGSRARRTSSTGSKA